MKIYGFMGITLIDYPGLISSMVFTGGCNMNCPFCHNPELVKLNKKNEILLANFYKELDKRASFVDGLVISGGEPLLQNDLEDFIIDIKQKYKLKIKLDSNGLLTDKLKNLIDKKLVDYIAMDIKSSSLNYSKASGVTINYKKIKKAMQIINDSDIPAEYRTTLVPGLVSKEDVAWIAQEIKDKRKYILQNFNNKVTLDNNLSQLQPYTSQDVNLMFNTAKKYMDNVILR